MEIRQFETELTRDGFSPAVAGDYPPGRVNDPHTHPFAVRGLVTGGNMWITIAGDCRDYRAGDVFAVAIGLTHGERVGADGVRYVYGCKPEAG